MRVRSLRLRIALLSAGISGLVLVAFGLLASGLIYRFGLERIDREILEHAHRHLSVRQGQPHWGRLEEALQFVYGSEGPGALILLVKSRKGEVLHKSSDWPSELPADEFNTPRPPPPRLRPPVLPPGDRPPPLAAPLPGPNQPPPLPITPPRFVTRHAGQQRWRIGIVGNPEVTMVIGISLKRLAAEMSGARNAFLAALPAALLVIAVGSWLVSQRALRPARRLAEVAERVTARGLDQRIPEGTGAAELDRLTTVFNEMMDRLEKSFHQAVRFSADAAHELKTPLTILQGELEQALQGALPGSEQQRTLNGLLEEVQRLKSIVQKLLLLSRADAGGLTPALERINLTETLEAICEDARALAPHLTVETNAPPDCWVMADPDLLHQALSNLTVNAIKYNCDGGRIRFGLRKSGSRVELAVSNTGDGIPPEDRDKVFDRFFRVDRSRGRKVEGVGLGLSLAREIVRAHGGDLVLADGNQATTTFRMTVLAAEQDVTPGGA